MKYLKYVIICITVALFLPKGVNASQTVNYTEYKVGDEITVWLDEAKTKTAKFRVIASSAAGKDVGQPDGKINPNPNADYQYVTAIYEKTVGDSLYGVASATDLSYASSVLRAQLVLATKDLGWDTPNEIRLLTQNDLSSLMNSSVPTYISSHLKERYPWMVLDKPYWLQEDAYKDTEQVISGMHLVSQEITVAWQISETGAYKSVKENILAGIRPVIKIHKGFVDGGAICNCEDCEEPPKEEKFCPNDSKISIQACIDGGEKEEVCIQKLCPKAEPPKEEKFCPNDSKVSIQTCIDNGEKEEVCIQKLCPGTKKPDNPKTGTYISLGVLTSSLILGGIYLILNRKKYFRKI